MRGQMQPQSPVDTLFLTEPEAACLLRLSRRTLQRLRNRADGPPFTRLGDRRLVYPTRHLLAWADGRRTDLMCQKSGLQKPCREQPTSQRTTKKRTEG
jgi:predicted DNA-binding transcriptional regulator AlpA